MRGKQDKELIARLIENWVRWGEGGGVGSSGGMFARVASSGRRETSIPCIAEEAERTERALSLVSERERDALMFHYRENLPQVEQGRMLGLGERQVRNVLRRAEEAFVAAWRDGQLDRAKLHQALENPITPIAGCSIVSARLASTCGPASEK